MFSTLGKRGAKLTFVMMLETQDSSNMISIPCPAPLRIPTGYVIARMNMWECTYILHWLEDTRQILVEYVPDKFDLESKEDPATREWILQMDGSISDSLSAIVNCSTNNIRVANWKLTSGQPLNGDCERFLDCAWSDYAVDKMSVTFDLRIVPVESVSRFASPPGSSPVQISYFS